MKIAVIGGGAAGFFAALSAKASRPDSDVVLFERTAQLLSKVKISGGGRCNVTHACFDPRELTQNYPRGRKELLGPFHRFQPRDTVEWFQKRGVELKKEEDGRMFPRSNCSETIIRCLLDEAHRLGIEVRTQVKLTGLEKNGQLFELTIADQKPFQADMVILATGSSRHGWEFARSLGHAVRTPVPSLFTFNIDPFPLRDRMEINCTLSEERDASDAVQNDEGIVKAPIPEEFCAADGASQPSESVQVVFIRSLKELAGVSTAKARIRLEGSGLSQTGPLLITHWGFSGPCALKLSAWGARFLAECHYRATLHIDWLPDHSEEEIRSMFAELRKSTPSGKLRSFKVPHLPKSLLKALLERSRVSPDTPYNGIGKGGLAKLCDVFKRDPYVVSGKTTNKEEFVTCGGIALSEVNFKTMESKVCPGLFLCGEILDIDGITGGFNFQNAWTTGWIAGQSMNLSQ